MVVALTKNMMLPHNRREKEYLDRLARADWRARLIKLADELDNYTDTLVGLKEGTGEETGKSRRILKLAAPDAKKHPETRRAIQVLRKLLKARKLK